MCLSTSILLVKIWNRILTILWRKWSSLKTNKQKKKNVIFSVLFLQMEILKTPKVSGKFTLRKWCAMHHLFSIFCGSMYWAHKSTNFVPLSIKSVNEWSVVVWNKACLLNFNCYLYKKRAALFHKKLRKWRRVINTVSYVFKHTA